MTRGFTKGVGKCGCYVLKNKWFFEVNLPYGQSYFTVNPGPTNYLLSFGDRKNIAFKIKKLVLLPYGHTFGTIGLPFTSTSGHTAKEQMSLGEKSEVHSFLYTERVARSESASVLDFFIQSWKCFLKWKVIWRWLTRPVLGKLVFHLSQHIKVFIQSL